jgi:seryl-tRNA synthetase
MIDLRRLRDDADYRRGIERKRVREGLLDEVLRLDADQRAVASEVQQLRARQNAASKEISRAAPDERAAKVEAAKALKDELTARESELANLDSAVRALALQVPNTADATVPDGGEDDGDVIREVGTRPAQPPARDHAEYAEWVGIGIALRVPPR